MVEREPAKETVGQGDLFFLWHPATGQIFSGYGLAMHSGSNELLSGLLMVDRPWPADPEWLAEVEATFAGAPTQAGLQPALGRGGAGLELAQAFDNRSERPKRAPRGVKDRTSINANRCSVAARPSNLWDNGAKSPAVAPGEPLGGAVGPLHCCRNPGGFFWPAHSR